MGTHFRLENAAPDYAREATQMRLLCWALSCLVVVLAVVAFTVPGASGWAPIVAGMVMAPAMTAYAFSAPPPDEDEAEQPIDEPEATLVA